MGALAASAASAQGSDPAWFGIAQAGDLLRRRKLSAVELTEACLRRVETHRSLNAFITPTAEEALAQARTLDGELRSGRRRGPLHGIPVALKDVIDTAGVRTTAGSAHYAGRVPSEDAEVVKRLKAAGAVLLGKLNMDEFAYNFTSETSHFGPSRNPWNTRRSPGGSSGGAGIAVATGMCFAALGTDTGGSVRLPAALCGITGMKPSYGRVSVEGVLPLAWSLDHVGPMCRSARDTELVLAAIGGAGAAPVEVKRLRLAIPRSVLWQGIEPEVDRAVRAAAVEMGRLTAGVEEIPYTDMPASPRWPDLPLIYSQIISAEAYAFHEGMLKRNPEKYHAGTRGTLEGGAGVSAADYIRARREMERLRADAARPFAGADVLLTPTAPSGAFELGGSPGLVYLRNSAPWNVYGLPSVSIPCGFTADGLPIGIQLTGRAGHDETVLRLAEAYQQATDWHAKRPE
jgi:aspartyl-tRNA(Asn)/glutamyl-tRNA(Gln) amidotransferase subunit A